MCCCDPRRCEYREHRFDNDKGFIVRESWRHAHAGVVTTASPPTTQPLEGCLKHLTLPHGVSLDVPQCSERQAATAASAGRTERRTRHMHNDAHTTTRAPRTHARTHWARRHLRGTLLQAQAALGDGDLAEHLLLEVRGNAALHRRYLLDSEAHILCTHRSMEPVHDTTRQDIALHRRRHTHQTSSFSAQAGTFCRTESRTSRRRWTAGEHHPWCRAGRTSKPQALPCLHTQATPTQ